MPTSTFHIYENAARFQECFGAQAINPDETVFCDMRSWLRRANLTTPFKGIGLLIEAGVHIVTPAPLDEDEIPSSRSLDTEKAAGVFKGVFIGYNAIPFRNPLTDSFSIVLGTVLDAETAAQGEEYQRVFVQTPIPCAEIELAD